MSGGEIAALIAAGAFLLLVGILAVPILKLGKTVDAATHAINRITDRTDPVLAELLTTVNGVNHTLVGVNKQLGKVDTVTDHVATISGNVSNLAGLFSATLGGPLVKAASFAYGVKSAIKARRKSDVEKVFKEEMRRPKHGGA